MKTRRKTIFEIAVLYGVLLAMTTLPFFTEIYAPEAAHSLWRGMAAYALMAAAVIIPCLWRQRRNIFRYLGFSPHHVGRQLLVSMVPLGVSLITFLCVPLFFSMDHSALLPHGGLQPELLLIRLVCFIFFVGPVEVVVFRGYLFAKLREVIEHPVAACAVSALLYGFWHYPTTQSLATVGIKTLIGFVYALCKVKVKHCTTLSVSVAHSLHGSAMLALSYLLQ